MPKEDTQIAQAPVEVFDLTLEEFCTRLSSRDRRVEMIAGFEHAERAAGRVKGSESGYADRYAAFVNQPVL